METINPPVSACRYCQFYRPIGRRGGSCQMLGVSVQGGWKGCHIGITAFSPVKETYSRSKPNDNLINKSLENTVQEFTELQTQNLTRA